MSRLFVSYSRSDSEVVDRAVAALERAVGHEVWLDRRSLPPAIPWLAEIRDAIEGAILIVAFESESFSSSVHCGAELAIAEEFSRPVVRVDLADSPTSVAAKVIDALGELPQTQSAAIDLAVRARTWDRAGRPSRRLPLGKSLARLRAARPLLRTTSGPVDLFLRAARRKQYRRRGLLSFGGLLVFFMLATPGGAERSEERGAQRMNELADRLHDASEVRSFLSSDYYGALAVLASSGDTESALVAQQFTDSYEFVGPSAIERFAVPTRSLVDPVVVESVRVSLEDSTFWEIPADQVGDVGSNQIEPLQNALEGSTIDPDWVAVNGSLIEVVHDGVLVRRFPAPAKTSAVQLAPDGRTVAAVTPSGVAMLDVSSGTQRRTLVGSPEAILEVRWSSDSARLWGRTNMALLAWDVRTSRVLVDDRDAWFVSLAVLGDDLLLLAAERSGQLRLLERESGELFDSHPVSPSLLWAEPMFDPDFVLLGYQDRLEVYSLSRRASVQTFGDCEAVARALAWKDGAFLGCGNSIRSVDNSFRERWASDFQTTVRAIEFDERSGLVLVGEDSGRMAWVASDRADGVQNPVAGCLGSVLDIALSSSGKVLPVGVGTDQLYCDRIGEISGSGVDFGLEALGYATPDTNRSRAAVGLSDGESFVVGFSDGLVVASPIENLLPQVPVFDVRGEVWDMIEADGELFVATQTGQIVAIPVARLARTSNRQQAADVAEYLELASDLGLVE